MPHLIIEYKKGKHFLNRNCSLVLCLYALFTAFPFLFSPIK